MATRAEIAPDVQREIDRHFAERHRDVTPLPGKKGARRARVNVTWLPEVPDVEDASIICRLCSDGWNRFYVNWDPAAPTAFTLRRIRRHFAEQHGIDELAEEFISYAGYTPDDEKAAWFPATFIHNSGFHCRVCLELARPDMFENPHQPIESMFIDPSPFADARRLDHARFRSPDIVQRLVGLSPPQRAIMLEAVARGELDEALAIQNRALVEVILRLRRAGRPKGETVVREATKQLLLHQVSGSPRGVTAVIDNLAAVSARRSSAFTKLVGNQIEGYEQASVPEILKLLERPMNHRIRYSRRQLWALWIEIEEAERKKATGPATKAPST